MPTVLIIGATRGLGAELVKQYAARPETTVLATSRTSATGTTGENIHWVHDIDIATPGCGPDLVAACRHQQSKSLDLLLIPAGYFATETFDQPDWAAEERMYRTSAIGPVFVVHHLVQAHLFTKDSKIMLLSSESGSVALRHESEGGGNYAHHASKAALNMVGRLLSIDLKERGIMVGILHPAFMRTEMTRGVGFDQFWDKGGAVTPDVAAKSLVEFIDSFEMSMTGQYWAPRGPGDIGTAEAVLGKGLPTPLQLPW